MKIEDKKIIATMFYLIVYGISLLISRASIKDQKYIDDLREFDKRLSYWQNH